MLRVLPLGKVPAMPNSLEVQDVEVSAGRVPFPADKSLTHSSFQQPWNLDGFNIGFDIFYE